MEDDTPDHRLLNHRHRQPRVIHCNCDAEYEAALREAGKSLVVVDAFAEWCGPCKALSPIVGDLAAEYGERIDVVKIDVDAAPELAERYSIRSIPTFMIFDRGTPIETMVGVATKRELASALDKHVA